MFLHVGVCWVGVVVVCKPLGLVSNAALASCLFFLRNFQSSMLGLVGY